jgi:beta-N-acetylhexosaminidase
MKNLGETIPRAAFIWLLGVTTIACAAHTPVLHVSSTPPPVTATPPAPSPTPTHTASCAQVVFAGLSMPQRIGQLFALGLANDELGTAEIGAIRTDHIGSAWFTETTTQGATVIRAVTAAVQAQATPAATGGVRFFVAANQEGGEIQALRGRGFARIPSATTQGTLAPATLAGDAQIWGDQLARAGVNLNFAPVLDVVPPGTEEQNAPIGALNRQFGSDPTSVATHGVAFIQGMTAARVVTVAKHFPGLGRVQGNTDEVAGVIDTETTAQDTALQPFRAAIAAGVPMVMVSLATYTRIDPAHPAAFSSRVLRLLRVGMGFGGVIVSDSLTATAVASIPPAQRAVDFLSAGGDLIVSRTVGPTEAMVAAVAARASSDRAFRGRVNDAVRRVLAEKSRAGLLPCSAG